MNESLMISDEMLDRVCEIEERHNGIVSIQRGIMELNELFNSLSILIDEQQVLLDDIENAPISFPLLCEKTLPFLFARGRTPKLVSTNEAGFKQGLKLD